VFDEQVAPPRPAVTATPTLRTLVPSTFLPCMVFELANGAIAPVVALTALDLGASVGMAGFMLALLGIGQVAGDVPAASVANRIGERRAMIAAATVAAGALLWCALARSLLGLGVALLVIGLCTAVFYLARQVYLTEVVPPQLRARAMSTLGGSHRIGLFIGPFAGAAAIHLGGLHAAYYVAIAAVLASAGILVVVPEIARDARGGAAAQPDISARSMLRSHRRLLATLGVGILAVGMVRSARQTVLPLWGHHIGLDAAQVSLVFGIASAADMALFYPAGKVMDHFGRLAVALPAMLVLGAAMTTLPLTASEVSLLAVAIVMSLGNGIGAGIMMTLGADVAPVAGRTLFLSVWRVMGDSGNAAGPLVVSAGAIMWSLAAGIVAMGLVGVTAAVILGVWTPRYSPYATPKSARAARFTAAVQRTEEPG
jgi:MFS family permease